MPRLTAPLIALVLTLAGPVAGQAAEAALSARAALGRQIFFDRGLSEPRGQACASCHDPAVAFSEPRRGPTSRGVQHALVGPRNAPSLMYAAFAPALQSSGEGGGVAYLGGQFRDGRVNFLEDQVRGPLLNPIEMANADEAMVVGKLRGARYAAAFEASYGSGIFDRPDEAFRALADALAQFERSAVFAPFSSKYDAWQQGRTTLSPAEERGRLLFNDAAKGNCASCHPSTTGKAGTGRRALFTDFGYDNVGVPRNPANRFYDMPASVNPDGRAFVDIGLRNTVMWPGTRGQFKAPTLRNIAVTGPYMHNGYFKTLRGLVDFYNTRDVKPACHDDFVSEAAALRRGCWPRAEVTETVNTSAMGRLGLSEPEVDDLVAFLGTLTDGWTPVAARPR